MASVPSEVVRPDRFTLLAFTGVVVFGGINAIAVKKGVEELAPLWSAGLRFVIPGLLLVVVVVATRRPFPRARGFTGAILYGVAAIAGSYALIYSAVRDVPAGTTMVLIALVPVFTFALAIFHGQERFHVQGQIGALIALGVRTARLTTPLAVRACSSASGGFPAHARAHAEAPRRAGGPRGTACCAMART